MPNKKPTETVKKANRKMMREAAEFMATQLPDAVAQLRPRTDTYPDRMPAISASHELTTYVTANIVGAMLALHKPEIMRSDASHNELQREIIELKETLDRVTLQWLADRGAGVCAGCLAGTCGDDDGAGVNHSEIIEWLDREMGK